MMQQQPAGVGVPIPQANQQWMMMQPQPHVYQQPPPLQQQQLQQSPMQQQLLPMQQPISLQQSHMQQPPPLPLQQQPPPMMQPQYIQQPPPMQPLSQTPQQQSLQQQPLQMQDQSHMTVHQQPPQSYEEIKTLWIGDLQYWMEENYLRNCFAGCGEAVLSTKVIRNRQTMMSEGYGFIEFQSHTGAERVLVAYNGSIMPQTEQAFRLNWASFGVGERRGEGTDHSIFVGDLAPDVTDYMLLETFRSKYPSVKGAKVVMDTTSGRSKGYGFVKFGDDTEKGRAMVEMNGSYCSSRPMRISIATPRKGLAGATQQFTQRDFTGGGSYGTSQSFPSDNDPNNTTIFVGGLDPSTTDEDLRVAFSQFGEIAYVKIPVGKNCGFVQFSQRPCAEEALQKLHGQSIGKSTVRLSWGRPPGSKMGQQGGSWGGGQMQTDPNQWNSGGYYGYGQGYEGYGYVQAPQDPAASYAYGNYAVYGS